MKRRILVLCSAVAAMLVTACGGGGSDAPAVARQFQLPNDFYPESIAVDSSGTFYVSSFRQGAIARLRPGETLATVFVPSGSNGLESSQGLVVDEGSNSLWNCSSDISYSVNPPTPTALKSFDLQSGAAKSNYVLPGGGFCDDVAIDSQGTVYVTDLLSARILRLRRGATALEVWAQGGDLAAGGSGFTVNGIAVDQESKVLYVSKNDTENYIVQIDIAADGAAGAMRRITFPRQLNHVDGLRVVGPGKLLLFENDIFGHSNAVSSASVTGNVGALTTLPTVSGLREPTSGVLYAGQVYYLESKFFSILSLMPSQLGQLPNDVEFVVRSVPLLP